MRLQTKSFKETKQTHLKPLPIDFIENVSYFESKLKYKYYVAAMAYCYFTYGNYMYWSYPFGDFYIHKDTFEKIYGRIDVLNSRFMTTTSKIISGDLKFGSGGDIVNWCIVSLENLQS